MAIPPRLLGYGAYNLAHDRYMGKPASGAGPIYFKYLRDGGWPVNLVKVICFRFSGQEGLPPVRRLSLYTPQRAINTSFIDNLVNTVDQARQFGFWVQVCLFSFHSIVGGEQPENAPLVFGIGDPGTKPADAGQSREWIKRFFNADDAPRFQEQVRLVRLIVDRLRGFPNVLWELANELRISNQAASAAENCGLAKWLNRMRAEVVGSMQGVAPTLSTSSGVVSQSERFFFKRLATDNCAQPALPVEYFDFHSGQWDPPNYQTGIQQAKNRAAGYKPSAFLIINDDGLKGAATATDIRAWAAAAFRLGLHYAAKQSYPPAEQWNTAVLNAMKQAFENPNAY